MLLPIMRFPRFTHYIRSGRNDMNLVVTSIAAERSILYSNILFFICHFYSTVFLDMCFEIYINIYISKHISLERYKRICSCLTTLTKKLIFIALPKTMSFKTHIYENVLHFVYLFQNISIISKISKKFKYGIPYLCSS